MEPVVKGLLPKQSPGPPASLVGSLQHPNNASQTFPNSCRSGAASKLSIASAAPDTKAKKDIMDKQRWQVNVSDKHRCQSPLQTNKVGVNSQWKEPFTTNKRDLCLTYRMAPHRQKAGLHYVGRKNKQTSPITDMKFSRLGFVTTSSYLAQAGLESMMWPWQALNSWQSFCSVFQALRLQVCTTTLAQSQQIPCRRCEPEHKAHEENSQRTS